MAQDKQENTDIYKIKIDNIAGETVDFDNYRGKTLLIVNTASNCGFTNQYGGLEKLYQEFKDKGFLVLGFPSNDFASQEPGSNEDIKKFCKLRFGVSFPLFKKSSVKGSEKNQLYKLLTENSSKKYQGEIGWNFVKFLVNKEGQIVGRYSSIRSPKSLKNKIKEIL
ncbi:UNVERIFIED_CONTAM: hypothetical protein GTU68_025281 [Idotea baltica]|nr:hypothetical protein [Idotea baltica]